MKIFTSVMMSLMFSFSSFAAELPESLCNFKDYRDGHWGQGHRGGFLIKGSSVSGAKARRQLIGLRASRISHRDELGIVRYFSVKKSTLVDSEINLDPCKGNVYIHKDIVCTWTGRGDTAACSSFCRQEWRGEDCR